MGQFDSVPCSVASQEGGGWVGRAVKWSSLAVMITLQLRTQTKMGPRGQTLAEAING